MLELQFPEKSHSSMYDDIIAELERDSVEFLHPANTFTYRKGDYHELIEKCVQVSKGEVEGLVPADTYFAVDKGRIVGAIQLRHNIDHPDLEFKGGHIGYGIRPSERSKGYASSMLSQVLERAKELGLEKVLITCDTTNVGSNKVIQKNGGVLEKECDHEDGTSFNRYWINI